MPPNSSAGGTWAGQGTDRRKRRRFLAQWHVQLCSAAEKIVDALTKDVSSGGFYCRSPRAFSLGERLTAVLEMPSTVVDRQSALVLSCDVYVLRVEALLNDCGWGIALKIVDYSLVRAENPEMHST